MEEMMRKRIRQDREPVNRILDPLVSMEDQQRQALRERFMSKPPLIPRY
jgi:hypothetical protein